MENPRQGAKLDENYRESMESSSSVNDSEPSSSSSLSADSDLADDATSPSTSSSSSPSRRGGGGGALYQFADLMAQLPIKRGLSKYYNGKSESFGSLMSLSSGEDLAKKEMICSYKRMKWCKSYGSNLNRHKFSPKAAIAKRSPKGTFNIFT